MPHPETLKSRLPPRQTLGQGISMRPLVIGLPSITLDDSTRTHIKKINPTGFILFKRNCENAEQLTALCSELTRLSNTSPPLIFIDQEGGRVKRINWQTFPDISAHMFGEWFEKSPEQALEAVRLHAFLQGAMLSELGITANCAPVADVRQFNTHDVIGNRAYGESPAVVSTLCSATISGLLAGGVWPVIKHAPGHGRATVDSHITLPFIEADLETLSRNDFLPFQNNAACPFVMTAHVKVQALDAENCATQSSAVIQYMRKNMHLNGILLSDDLFMNALGGTLRTRAELSLNAGCELLICGSTALDGRFDGEKWLELATLTTLPDISPETHKKIATLPLLTKPPEDVIAHATQRLAELLASRIIPA